MKPWEDEESTPAPDVGGCLLRMILVVILTIGVGLLGLGLLAGIVLASGL